MAIAKFCPECGAAVAGAKFCPECGTSTAAAVAREDEPLKLSHEEQVEILEKAIAQCAREGWHEWTQRPTPYEVSLRRKTGVFARAFMALWVEEDGRVMTNYVGEGGRIQVVPFVFFPLN